MGNIFLNRGEYQQAIILFKRALAIYPKHEKSLHNITVAFIKSQKLDEAREYADLLTARYYHENYLNLKAFILIKQNMPRNAIPHLARALRLSPFNRNATVNLAAAFTLTGKYGDARALLRRILQIYPKDMTALLYLIENGLRSGNDADAGKDIERLLQSFSVGDIKSSITAYAHNNAETVYSPVLLAGAVGEAMSEKVLE
jgi:tetratricopeptide (TPR) repeat protein